MVHHLRSRLSHWWEQQTEIGSPPHVEWRYRPVGSLGATGDILREVRDLMEPDQFIPTPMADVWQPKNESTGDSASDADGKERGKQ